MSFESLKNQHGTRLIQAVAIYPNACKYSTDEALANGECVASADYSDSYTGNITVSGGDLTFFGASSNSYLRIGDEIAKCTVVNSTTVNITARAQLGTTAEAITTSDSLRVVHGGEADGSCRGYPKRPDGKGCSNDDSFDRDINREFLITDTQLVSGEIYYNGLNSISHNPVILKPAEAMAKNASVTVSITDNEDGDQYSVPYPSQRNSNSTYLRKLIARTGGYLRNRKMIVYSGFTEGSSFDPVNCISREYIIDNFNIGKGDRVTIIGKDPLMLAEETKAKTHDVSAGVLLADVTNASTQITLKNFAVGEYGNDTDTGTAIIDNELIDYTVNNSVLGILDINARAVAGSEQKDHKINASVQKCLVLTDFNPVQAIIDRLQARTSIETRFYDDYTDVIATIPSSTGTAYVTKPESLKDFNNTLIQSWAENNISMYFDELAKKIKIKAVGDFSQQPVTLTDDDIILDSIEIKNKYDDQITRASIGFAPFDASKKTNEENSSIIFQSINLDVELSGTLEPQEAKTFYSKFLTDSDNDVSIAVGGVSRIANVNKKPPQEYSFMLDYEKYGSVSGGVVEEGEIINVTTELSIDDDGQPLSQNLQILSIKDDMEEKKIKVTAVTYQDLINEDDFDFIIDESKEDYVLSNDFAPPAGDYTIFIASNVTIGSTSTANFALDTGAQASGVTFTIINRGQILAAGGDGGDGRPALAPDPDDFPSRFESVSDAGFDGGDALNITVPTVIDITQGVIYSGGGGVPSGISIADSTVSPVYVEGGNGGSGGQGYVGGNGGAAGVAEVENTATDTGINGADGSRGGAGSLGGLSGGSWGEAGQAGEGLAAGGEAGFAIKSNSNSVTLIGDNEATIRGKRDF
ncbi:phage tail fiber adhesin [Pseudoalteromonas phage H105/1]|uniref:tail fiber protein n=1 Tax=Pseudoalteromonas phage H105/1 TaxID=877240 RepID=UPI0001E439F0|nr:tail fiber protein [Pseudoalteromonas phage H105/1]ADM26705.1 phage tail fiber adhesin [Pseudoalteromonas phage H105/1]